MFRPLRQLRIPLAAKCQLLFGIAAVLIIAAALVVPWTRMEQLTRHLNERSAQTAVRIALAEHVARAGRPLPEQIGAPLSLDGQVVQPAELISSSRIADAADDTLRFALAAHTRFERRPDATSFDRLVQREDAAFYRYAEPLRAVGRCLECHATAATAPVVVATTTPAVAPLIGVATVEIPSQVSNRQALLNRVFMLLAGLIAGTLAIIILYLVITRLILQPVRVLQETAEKVSQGNLDIRADINSGDEFQQLSETFNTMLRNLAASGDELRAANKSLDTRLGQLAEANVALYESNRVKSEFLASVSHELRTPLNSILGFAELLKDTAANDAKVGRYVANITRSGKSLLELINDLLDLAKIEAGRMEVRLESISLTDVFEGLSNLLRPLCEPRKIAIVPKVDPAVPIVRTDPAKLQQILYNLLSNAIKFSPSDETIDLIAERFEADLRIRVIDRGPGVPTDKQDLIFEKFRQLDQSVTREHGGTGLGLAIARELATLLGGKIGIDSQPGTGATFWLELPIEPRGAGLFGHPANTAVTAPH